MVPGVTTGTLAITAILGVLFFSDSHRQVLATTDESHPASEMRCLSINNTYTARVNVHGGELGTFQFDECKDVDNPTLYFEVGETYTIIQKDRTNWRHPLGIAYSAYGDEEIKLELFPDTTKNPESGCIEMQTCPAPMYFSNDEYLGVYSNIPEIEATTLQGDNGQEPYRRAFKQSIHSWSGDGTYSLKLRFDDETLESDLFYFCLIHEFMGGRIKLMKGGIVLNELDVPSMGYDADVLSEFDLKCGTHGLGDYQLPNPSCLDQYVCDTDGKSESLQLFSECVDAMNCRMFSEMTTGVEARSVEALFCHQMIPHHQNVVNMAKTVLHTVGDQCDDMSKKDDLECKMKGTLYAMINVQNLQIQSMWDYLDSIQAPPKDTCDVEIRTIDRLGR